MMVNSSFMLFAMLLNYFLMSVASDPEENIDISCLFSVENGARCGEVYSGSY